MEYYSATRRNETLNFVGKWIELEKIILQETTQTQKDKHHMWFSCVVPGSQSSDVSKQCRAGSTGTRGTDPRVEEGGVRE